MILFLWECKQSGSLSEVNPHFTPQLLSKKQLHAITSCGSRGIRLLPLKVESFQDDLIAINRVLDIDYIPPHTNSTSLPDQDWTFSDSADLVDLPLSKLYAEKVIPKSGSLRNALQQDLDFNEKYMAVFGHDYELLRWMDRVRQTGKSRRLLFMRPSMLRVNALRHCFA